jgi:hypothetical protein
MKLPKNIINTENRTKVIGVLTVLILFWLLLYFIPEIFASLFTTLLGNLILFTISILVLMYDIRYGIIVSIILIVVYRFTILTKTKTVEGFTWDQKSQNDFLVIQNTINRNKIFDVNLIQETQANQEELNYFNKNLMWPWSQGVQDLYKESVNKNPYIRTYSGDAINYARKIYNESAILRILSYQTKEGQFLLTGIQIKDPSGNKFEDLPNGYGDFAYKSGLIENKSDDVIKCNMKNLNGATLERISYTGKGGIFGEQTAKTTPVDYNDLESIIPGFKFVNGTPCNPCGAINENPDYSCPFNIKLQKQEPFMSSIWKYLWNI